MKISIHQPEHLPWLGFFHKMVMCDGYVLLDNVPFTKNNWQNRNRIADRTGKPSWLTVPVLLKGHTTSTIREMKINNRENWQRKYWGRLYNAYCKHPYFKVYEKELHNIINSSDDTLLEINLKLIHFFRIIFQIDNKLFLASDLDVQGKRSELLLNVCRKLGASIYLSGPSGKNYLHQNIFKENGIKIEYHQFVSPRYESPKFHPNLSAIDLIMNCGKNSADILRKC